MMKKILLSIALLLGIAFAAEAQTEAGKFGVGGMFGFTSSHVSVKVGDLSKDPGNTNALNLTPSFGYFLIDNLAIGADFSLKHSSSGKEKKKHRESTFSFMPHVVYFLDLHEVIKPYAKVSLGVATQHSTQLEGLAKSMTGFAWGAGVGVATFLNSHVAISTNLSYYSTIFNTEILGQKITTIPGVLGVNVGFSIFL